MKCWYLCSLLIHAYVHYWKLPKYCFDCLFLNAWSSLFLDPDTTGYSDPIPMTLCFIITTWSSLFLDPDPTEYTDPIPLTLCFIIVFHYYSLALSLSGSWYYWVLRSSSYDVVFYHYSLALTLSGSWSYWVLRSLFYHYSLALSLSGSWFFWVL